MEILLKYFDLYYRQFRQLVDHNYIKIRNHAKIIIIFTHKTGTYEI